MPYIQSIFTVFTRCPFPLPRFCGRALGGGLQEGAGLYGYPVTVGVAPGCVVRPCGRGGLLWTDGGSTSDRFGHGILK